MASQEGIVGPLQEDRVEQWLDFVAGCFSAKVLTINGIGSERRSQADTSKRKKGLKSLEERVAAPRIALQTLHEKERVNIRTRRILFSNIARLA